MCVNDQCSLRWHGAEGDLSVLGTTGRVTVCDMGLALAAIAVTDSSTEFNADFVRSREITFAVVKTFKSPNS